MMHKQDLVVLTFHGCTFEVLIFRFLMTSKRRFLVRKREFRGDSLFILDLVLNLKFQASSHLLWLYSPVCVGHGRKPRRPVFSERGSIKGETV